MGWKDRFRKGRRGKVETPNMDFYAEEDSPKKTTRTFADFKNSLPEGLQAKPAMEDLYNKLHDQRFASIMKSAEKRNSALQSSDGLKRSVNSLRSGGLRTIRKGALIKQMEAVERGIISLCKSLSYEEMLKIDAAFQADVHQAYNNPAVDGFVRKIFAKEEAYKFAEQEKIVPNNLTEQQAEAYKNAVYNYLLTPEQSTIDGKIYGKSGEEQLQEFNAILKEASITEINALPNLDKKKFICRHSPENYASLQKDSPQPIIEDKAAEPEKINIRALVEGFSSKYGLEKLEKIEKENGTPDILFEYDTQGKLTTIEVYLERNVATLLHIDEKGEMFQPNDRVGNKLPITKDQQKALDYFKQAMEQDISSERIVGTRPEIEIIEETKTAPTPSTITIDVDDIDVEVIQEAQPQYSGQQQEDVYVIDALECRVSPTKVSIASQEQVTPQEDLYPMTLALYEGETLLLYTTVDKEGNLVDAPDGRKAIEIPHYVDFTQIIGLEDGLEFNGVNISAQQLQDNLSQGKTEIGAKDVQAQQAASQVKQSVSNLGVSWERAETPDQTRPQGTPNMGSGRNGNGNSR